MVSILHNESFENRSADCLLPKSDFENIFLAVDRDTELLLCPAAIVDLGLFRNSGPDYDCCFRSGFQV
jgi:hypothetical protein